MKRLLFALFLLLGVSPVYAQNSTICYTTNGTNCVKSVQAALSVPISVAAATTTQLVALSAGKRIYITAWDVISAGTGTVTLVYGTGTNCGSGTTSLTGAYPLIAQAGIAKGNGLGPILFVPAGNAICIAVSTSVQVSGSLSYVQF